MVAVAEFEAATGAQATVEEYGLVRFAPGGAEYLDDLMSLFEDQGLNYAVWEWASFWAPYSSQVNDFNWRFGTDPENAVDVVNALQNVLARYWALNRLRPSNVSWLNE